MEEVLHGTGAKVMEARSFWLFRPNDEARLKDPNRQVALEMAKKFGEDSGKAVLASAKKP